MEGSCADEPKGTVNGWNAHLKIALLMHRICESPVGQAASVANFFAGLSPAPLFGPTRLKSGVGRGFVDRFAHFVGWMKGNHPPG